MKKYLITVFMLFGFVVFSNAQTGKATKKSMERPSATEELKTLTTELNLTDEQQAKVKTYLEERENNKPSKDNVGSKSSSSSSKRSDKPSGKGGHPDDSKLKEILTTEQYQKYESYREKNRPSGKPGEDFSGGDFNSSFLKLHSIQ